MAEIERIDALMDIEIVLNIFVQISEDVVLFTCPIVLLTDPGKVTVVDPILSDLTDSSST